jgi:PAS domain S-box-containing protein
MMPKRNGKIGPRRLVPPRNKPNKDELLCEIEKLRTELTDAKKDLQAIKSGGVDAVVTRRSAEQQSMPFPATETERQFHELADSIPNLAWMANSDGWVFWYNQRWYDYTGTTPAEMQGWGWQSVHDPNVLPRFMKRWKAAIQNGEPLEKSFPLRGADGVFRPFLTRVVPVKDAEGKVVRWFGTSTEISAQKQIEEALKGSEALARARTTELAAILDAVPAVLFIAHDPQCRRITSSRAALELLRLPAGSNTSMSSPVNERPTNFRTIRGGRELSPEELPVQMAAATGQAVRNAELMLAFDDGSSRHILGDAVPLRDERGNVRGAVGAFLDITERKRMEEALRQSERLYRAIGDSIDYGIWMCDGDGRNIYASESFLKLVGLTQEQCSDFGWVKALHPDDADRTITAWKECVRTRGHWEVEQRYRGVDGRLHPILARGVPVRDDKGQLTHWVGIHLDISRLKDAERALMRSEKLAATGRLAATIAHEINNPLEAVTNLLYLIAAEPDPSRVRKFANLASAELARVSHITRQTLGFYRDSSAPQPVCLSDLLDGVLSLYDKEFHARKVVCEKHYDTPGEIQGFAGEMRQVLSNLIQNALDATPEGGTIRIWTRPSRKGRENGVSVFISDDGPGIKPENQQKIFEPFFTTKGQKGTGLGLWVSKDLVQKHGGIIRVRSSENTRRKGTCFWIFIPYRTGAARA